MAILTFASPPSAGAAGAGVTSPSGLETGSASGAAGSAVAGLACSAWVPATAVSVAAGSVAAGSAAAGSAAAGSAGAGSAGADSGSATAGFSSTRIGMQYYLLFLVFVANFLIYEFSERTLVAEVSYLWAGP